MKIYSYFLVEFEYDNFDNFIDFINSVDTSKDYIINIYLTCKGGYTHVMDMMVNLLNKYNHQIYASIAESAGFEFLYRTTGPIIFTKRSRGMFHTGKIGITFRDNNKLDELAKIQMKESSYEMKANKEIMKNLKFTKKEKKAILSNKDVYFDHKRLKELFKYRKKPKKIL